MSWNISSIYIFFFFSIQNIKCSCYIIFLKFSPITFSWWKTYFLLVIFIYKRFNFCNSLWIFFLFLHDLTRLLQRIESSYYLFYWYDLFLLCMIHHGSDLFYGIYNTINEHNQRQAMDSKSSGYFFKVN